MPRAVTIALISCLIACSTTPDTPAPPRTVLLQYAHRPTVADSLAASGIAGAPAFVHPIIHSISVRTTLPTNAFSALNSKPEVDDVDSLEQRSCGAFSIFFLTDRSAIAADSAVIASLGAAAVYMAWDGPNSVAADFRTTTLDTLLSTINTLVDDPNIVTGDLDLGCLTVLQRAR